MRSQGRGRREGEWGQSNFPDEMVQTRTGLGFVQAMSVPSGVSSCLRCDSANLGAFPTPGLAPALLHSPGKAALLFPRMRGVSCPVWKL